MKFGSDPAPDNQPEPQLCIGIPRATVALVCCLAGAGSTAEAQERWEGSGEVDAAVQATFDAHAKGHHDDELNLASQAKNLSKAVLAWVSTLRGKLIDFDHLRGSLAATIAA